MSKTFEIVPFHQHEILTVRENGEVLIPLKPVVEGMGLTWHGQFERIQRHPVLSKGIRVTRIPSQGGMQETTCLALNSLPGWLVTIQSERIKDLAVREQVILFQTDAFEVLFEHYFGGRNAAAKIEHSDRTARRRELPGLMDRIEREQHPEKRRVLYELIVRACDAEGITPPTLASLAPRAEEEEEAERLMIAIDNLVDRYPDLNHHRQSTMIAIRRRDMVAHGITPTKALCLHPRFRMDGTVNGRQGRGVKCWVFWRDEREEGNARLPQ